MDMTKYSDKKYTDNIYLTLSGHQTYQNMLLCCVCPKGVPHLTIQMGKGVFSIPGFGGSCVPFFWTNPFLISAACIPILFPLYLHYCIVGSIQWILYIYIPHVVFSRVFWLFWTCNMRDVRQPWPCLRHAMAFQARSGIDSCNSMLSAYVTGHCRWLPKKWWGKFGDVHTPLGFSE